MNFRKSLLNKSVKIKLEPVFDTQVIEGDEVQLFADTRDGLDSGSEVIDTSSLPKFATPKHKQSIFKTIIVSISTIIVVITAGAFVIKMLSRPDLVNLEDFSSHNIEYSKIEVARFSNIESGVPDIPKISINSESPNQETQVFTVDGVAYSVFNSENYRVYIQENSTQKLQIASLTKLMTALIIADTYELDDYLRFNKELPEDIEYTFKWEMGDSVVVEDALTTMLISSYNDLAYMFAANYEGGYPAFIEEMNNRAELYGMKDTSFANSYGFDDPENYSTVNDLKILINQFLKNEYLTSLTQIGGYDTVIYSPTETTRIEKVYSTNYLLGRDSRVVGLKTGSTENAGACFAGYFIMPSGEKLVTIILGSETDRFQETLKLIQYRLDNFE